MVHWLVDEEIDVVLIVATENLTVLIFERVKDSVLAVDVAVVLQNLPFEGMAVAGGTVAAFEYLVAENVVVEVVFAGGAAVVMFAGVVVEESGDYGVAEEFGDQVAVVEEFDDAFVEVIESEAVAEVAVYVLKTAEIAAVSFPEAETTVEEAGAET